ncbi:MAG: metallophosphoesterase [Nitrosomonas sp.]|nr:metallophosphoesterase [Nitrosomonas sp.]
MKTSQSVIKKITKSYHQAKEKLGYGTFENRYMEMIEDPPENRSNRLCVSLSDIHLTDGTVGFQNLSDKTWSAFYDTIAQRCRKYTIKEFVLVLDGDIVDMVRSSRWAEHGIYPWERERTAEFSKVVNLIIREIVEQRHINFFKWLQGLKIRLKQDSGVDKVKIVILLGNHDKELFCDQEALKYFYEKGLGQSIEAISEEERRSLGRMYGDEKMFLDPTQAPYFPFYYGDKGFRYFATHGQWRDADNNAKIEETETTPGWSTADGWCIDTWQKLRFSPFFEPCFGDTVATGVLSTFIYKIKQRLAEIEYEDPRLNCIFDELDLYRPTHAAIKRVLDEVDSMRKKGVKDEVTKIIEETLYECVMDWLSWEFTYQSSTPIYRIGLKFIKRTLVWMKSLDSVRGARLEIKSMAGLLSVSDFIARFSPSSVSLRKMKTFPSFMPSYQHYNFQIHGEGHTHEPLQEDLNVSTKYPSTYINFGTWRDQILLRKGSGYRRRGVLRAFFILDIVNDDKNTKDQSPRTFDYFVQDVVHWSDDKDAMNKNGRYEPKT